MNAGSQFIHSSASLALLLTLAACAAPADDGAASADADSAMQSLVDQYAVFRLESDLSHLSENDRQVVRLLIEAAQPMDDVFWQEAYGDKNEAFALAGGDDATRRFIEINYGPWDRLRGDGPFIEGVGNKPAGANFYPADMTADEFEAAAAENEALRSLYTLVRSDENGALVAHPYHEAFAEAHMAAAAKLREAAELASHPGLARYLMLRAEALETDDNQPSDMAWIDMKDNPIETYEDQMFGAKAAHEGFVLIEDMEWSERLARFAALLPSLQESLPVGDEYKAETPGTDSVRFGAASAHGPANMVRFNYFREQGAFSRDEATGTYRVDFDAMREAVAGLSELILTLQGNGDYDRVAQLLEEKGMVPPELQADLDQLDSAGIPRDIVFEQGVSVLFRN